MTLLVLLGCSRSTAELGSFSVRFDEGGIQIDHVAFGSVLEDLRLHSGEGEAEIEMAFGSFKVTDTATLAEHAGHGKLRGDYPVVTILEDASGAALGTLVLSAVGDEVLLLNWTPIDGDRTGFSASCDTEDHFLGLGGHAFDVDHVGEAFPLWTSEPGVGKVDTDASPDDWFITGSRHTTSFPSPFLLRPHRAQGLLVDTTSRVDVDLCATGDRFSATAWSGSTLPIVVIASSGPTEVVQNLTGLTGRLKLPPAWVFSPWNDAIRGEERIREVASRLRAAGAPASVIWTEDWKGAEQTELGYHLTGEWSADEDLYPEIATLAADLERDGFKWLAYFSPFIFQDTQAWEDAVGAGALVLNAEGDPYTVPGPPTGALTGMVDLSRATGRDWAAGWMTAALELGFDGWMADYGEWLPADAALPGSVDAMEAHNRYPEWWQQVNAEAIEDWDATFFVRSGWSLTTGLAPIVWAGDQRTSFDEDDGLPSVLPMGLGLAATGVAIYTHDVAGYQSIGNDPSDKELWFRWASLGAFSPILRTHHGAFDEDNWQFDTDEETLAHWVAVATENARLFPYRYGLAALAAKEGTPMLAPVGFRYPDDADWGRTDAWMLGALLVAPVIEHGATGREVELPLGEWFEWSTHEPASSGWFDADLSQIPVFVPANTLIPLLDEVPDTLVADVDELVSLDQADMSRTLMVFGDGGPFTEADGTTYRCSGTATGRATGTETMTSGNLEVGGLSVAIDGDVERSYTVVVIQ